MVEMGRIEAAVRGGPGRGSDVPPARHSLPLPSSISPPFMTNKNATLAGDVSVCGGDGENRTPVRKRFLRNFSGRRRLFAFPRPRASRHARGSGSFMMHGTLKALRTHGPHSSTPQTGPWDSRKRRSRIKRREEQCCRCSLIYKLPVLWMPGASARYSCLRTPVETSTSPRRQN